MAYEAFKNKKSKEDFCKDWSDQNLDKIMEISKDEAYNKYIVKSKIFQRDEFTCQNKKKVIIDGITFYDPCPFCKNIKEYPKLQWHHVKHKKNGGKDTVRNGVTICDKSHSKFNAGKLYLSFDGTQLPNNIKNKTFVLDKNFKINWKKIIANNKHLRKSLKEYCGIRLTSEQMALLIKWLNNKP